MKHTQEDQTESQALSLKRGRPRKERPKTDAERAKAYRARKKAAGQVEASLEQEIKPEPVSRWPRLNLPYGLGGNYALPYAICRGAIFSAMVWRGQSRPSCSLPTQVAEWGRMRVCQVAGERLDQGDADVYCGLVATAYSLPIGEHAVSVAFKADSFLRSLGRSRGSRSRKWLAASIERLKAATFEFNSPELGRVATSLVSKVEPGERAATYVLELSTVIDSIQQGGWALIQGDARRRLLKAPLAKSLHTFYSSHKVPMPISAAKLKKLTGHNVTRDQLFIPALVEALSLLKQVTGWHRCELDATTNLVVVEKNRTANSEIKTSKAMVGRRKRISTDYPWHIGSTADDLSKYGRKAFISSGDFDSEDVKFRLGTFEYEEVRRLIAAVPGLGNEEKMDILFDYLLTVRIPSDDPNDI